MRLKNPPLFVFHHHSTIKLPSIQPLSQSLLCSPPPMKGTTPMAEEEEEEFEEVEEYEEVEEEVEVEEETEVEVQDEEEGGKGEGEGGEGAEAAAEENEGAEEEVGGGDEGEEAEEDEEMNGGLLSLVVEEDEEKGNVEEGVTVGVEEEEEPEEVEEEEEEDRGENKDHGGTDWLKEENEAKGREAANTSCPDVEDPNLHGKTEATHAEVVSVQKEQHLLSGAQLSGRTFMDVELSPLSGQKVNDAVPLENNKLNDLRATQGVRQPDMLSKELNQNSLRNSRSFLPQVRPRSFSPGDDLKVGDKRQAMVCEFFRQGWCIKGKSCRFLHVIVHEGGSSRKPEAGLGDNAEGTKVLASESQQEHEGAKDEAHSAFGSVSSGEHGKDKFSFSERGISSSGLSSEKLPLRKDESWYTALVKEYGQDNREDYSAAEPISINGSAFVGGGSRFMGHRSFAGAYGVSSINRASSGLSSYPRGWDEVTGRFMPGDDSSSFGSPLDRQHFSSLRNCSSSYSYPRMGTNGEREDGFLRSSLLHNSSPFSASTSQKPPLTSFNDPELADYRARFTPYNWEPSVPFRPSHFFPSLSRSSPGGHYDPLRDSIDQPDARSKLLRPSSLPAEAESESKVDKNYHGSSKCGPVGEAESVATSATETQNKGATTKGISPNRVREKSEGIRMDDATHSKNQIDREILYKEAKVDKVIGSADVELDEYEEMHRELRAMKYFRGSVIEYVKELMKPFWHEGHLTKDAYKLIVQKVEEKVVSSFLPSQVPNTPDLVKQYLISSQTKMSKLIEGYLEKYKLGY
ncbi:FRIGIDA-ESSENTIAL 1-like protein [Drosera capensis]